MSYLLDTNVISEPKRKTPDASVLRFLAGIDNSRFFISASTIGEIKKGVVKLASGRLKVELEIWFESLRNHYAARILPITESTFLVWGKMFAEFEKKGIVRPTFDSLLEATALEHDLVLVTRNVKNFKDSSVTILNPWEY